MIKQARKAPGHAWRAGRAALLAFCLIWSFFLCNPPPLKKTGPKNRKTENQISQLEPKPPSGGQTKKPRAPQHNPGHTY
jgi:hypothetical protein